MFKYQRRVQFYETDLMGVVHHSNYLRFLEEARVAWGHAYNLIKFDQPETAAHFAVLETQVRHLKPLRFGDEILVEVEAKREGARILFQYRIFKEKDKEKEIVCLGRTEHIPLGPDLKPLKLNQDIRKTLEKSTWTETWLSNL
jgi:acyl-CoA thioester hydrolase